MNERIVKFKSVMFDKDQKTFTVLDGTEGTYPYTEIVKCSILNEDASYRGKTAPFVHQVLSGVTMAMAIIERSIYVGLRFKMKEGNVVAVYISKEKTRMNTDLYLKDVKEAKEVKALVDRIINKYQK